MNNDTKVIRAGIVSKRVEDDLVRVTVMSDGDCDNCGGSCGDSEGLLTNSEFEVTALDNLGVKEGDRVRLEIEPRSFGKLAAIVFGIPATMLLGGLGIGTAISNGFFAGQYSKALQGGLAGFLFLASLVGLVGYDRYLSANSSTRAEITEFLDENCLPAGISGNQ